MKKIRSYATIFAMAIITMFIFSMCMQKDSTPPHIILKGPNPYRIDLNDKYIEHYFEIYDNRDDSAALSVEILNEIDTLEEEDGYFDAPGGKIYMGVGATVQVGEYVVTYTIKDEAGNTTVATRDVIVTNEIDDYAKTYSITKENLSDEDQEYVDYLSTLEFDEEVNNRMWISKFGNLDFYSLTLYIDVVDDSIFLPLQAFPLSNNIVIEGIEDAANNGYAGELNKNSFTFDLKYRLSQNPSSTTPASEDFLESYSKTDVEN